MNPITIVPTIMPFPNDRPRVSYAYQWKRRSYDGYDVVAIRLKSGPIPFMVKPGFWFIDESRP